jgi:cytochrome c oxidase assembly protein subunit 15
MGYAALAAVIVQGVMGGLRVTEKSLVLAIIHGCFAQAFFCLTIAIALATSPRFAGGGGLANGDPARNRALRFWTTALVHSVFVQLILGALLRHLGGTHATVTHVFGAMLVGATLIMAAQHIFSRPESEGPLARWAIGLILLYGLQLVLGIVTYLVVNPLGPRNAVTILQRSLPTLHVAVGAFILGLSFTLAFKTRHLLGGQRDEATGVEGVPA